MSRGLLIKKGHKKISEGNMAHSLKNGISDKILEIVGATKADYFGTVDLDYFDSDTEIYRYKFYKYVDFELVECSFGAAINTGEYTTEKILIFSQEPEDYIQYYVAEILD